MTSSREASPTPAAEKRDVEDLKYNDAKDWSPSAAEDPENPHNWPQWKKSYQVFVLTCVAFLCPFGSSVYSPAAETIERIFGVSREVALLPFVFYLLGLSFGPVIAAPISETFGRKPVYVCAVPLAGFFTIGAGFSNNITALTVCRFFAGLSSSPGLSLGSGTIADTFRPDRRGIPMSVFVSAVQMGPALGPLIGGAVTVKEDWRWTQWVILFGLAFTFVVTCFMTETFKKCILQRRARRYHIEGPPVPQRTRIEFLKYFLGKTILRPIHMILTEPIVTFFDIYVAFNFGLLNAFFAAFSYVFQTTYGFGSISIGLTYLSQAVGSVVAFLIMVYCYEFIWKKESAKAKENGSGKMAPEKRLIIAKIGAPLLPISLFWFGWTAQPDIHWISPVIAESFFGAGNLLIFTCALLFLQDCYGSQYGASASSSNTFLRYLAAFAFPLFAVQMYEGLGTGWASSLLGFVAVALMPIPFVFSRFGEKLREKSKYIPTE